MQKSRNRKKVRKHNARRNPWVSENTPLTDILEECKLPPNDKAVIRQAAIELKVSGVQLDYDEGTRVWFVQDEDAARARKILKRLGRYHNSVFCPVTETEEGVSSDVDEDDDDEYEED